MSEEIIIDGVNVAECRFLDEWKHCDICDELCDSKCLIVEDIECKTYDDCYYKQLKRLQAENEELKHKNEILLGQLVINDGEDVTVQMSQSQFDEYNELTTRTDGMVVGDVEGADAMIEFMMSRYDSLPLVEESDAVIELPKLMVNNVVVEGDIVRVQFDNTGSKVLVILNEGIVGVVDGGEIVISGIDYGIRNQLVLVPLGDDVRGEGVAIELEKTTINFIPKAPNTGVK